MFRFTVHWPAWLKSLAVIMLFSAVLAEAQQKPARPREFLPGTLNRIDELPAGRLRTRIESLPAASRARALEHFRSFHFSELDLKTLEVDAEGSLFYVDDFTLAPRAAAESAESEPITAAAAVPVNALPASLLLHSKPGASSTIYLNFSGDFVTNTGWNSSLGRLSVTAVPFSIDSDFSTFNDAEQLVIKRVWQRVSEDYAPFDIDVTTETPELPLSIRTVEALITRNTDVDGNPNPSSGAGGIAYVGVFGVPSYIRYRPCWIYYNNVAFDESYIAEAVSHEAGHNFGLSHDGKTDGSAYYYGHGSGDTSWGPIMGTSYNRNVSQWSKGDYYQANNTQDDLATLAAKISYRADDHGSNAATATPLTITGGRNIVSTTPETDPANLNRANKGILERNTDVDVFSFTAGNGPVRLTVNPWITPSGTRGGNVDLVIELRSTNGTVIATNNLDSVTTAEIQTTLAQGTYYLFVRNTGTGDPFAADPTGYTAYGSVGQYFIDGTITPSGTGAPLVQLTTTANNSSWGTVTPGSGSYNAGTTIQIVATPSSYDRFVKWTNGVSGTSNSMTLTLQTNITIGAIFAEMVTTNNPTPYWWLAANGYTSNFETVIYVNGANGIPLWQSYLAGLNPRDSSSQIRLSVGRPGNGPNVLNWNTVTGRLYTLSCSTNLADGFFLVPGASNLPWTVNSFTNPASTNRPTTFYRLGVRVP